MKLREWQYRLSYDSQQIPTHLGGEFAGCSKDQAVHPKFDMLMWNSTLLYGACCTGTLSL